MSMCTGVDLFLFILGFLFGVFLFSGSKIVFTEEKRLQPTNVLLVVKILYV